MVNAVCGLVEEYSGPTVRQKGGVASTGLRAVLTPGTFTSTDDNNTAVIQCFAENVPDLPSTFGGSSGGGLWRVYMRVREGRHEIEHFRLIGIASRDDHAVKPPQIICQGLRRIAWVLQKAREMFGGSASSRA